MRLMTYDGYETLRQRLEEQLRADVELLQEAHRVKLRALETVAHARGELAGLPEPPAAPAPALPPPAQAAALPAAAPPPRRRSRAYAIHDAVDDALEKVGETFDKDELCAVMGFEPSRSTLYRVLGSLMRERRIALAEPANGSQPTRYRKLTVPQAPGDGDAPG
jgi:hypothetical protein